MHILCVLLFADNNDQNDEDNCEGDGPDGGPNDDSDILLFLNLPALNPFKLVPLCTGGAGSIVGTFLADGVVDTSARVVC